MGSIIVAAILAGYGGVFCHGMPNPGDDGRQLSDPAIALFPSYLLPEQAFVVPAIFAQPEKATDEPMTVWLDDNLRRTSLNDYLELIIPQPEHLTMIPSRAAFDPGSEALAPIIVPAVRSE